MHELLGSCRVPTAAKAPTERSQGGFAATRRSDSLLAIKRLGLNLAVLPQENFHLALSFLQFLPAGSGELHSFFEKRQRFFQGHFTLFQLLNDFFQALNTLFKFWQREGNSWSDFTPDESDCYRVKTVTKRFRFLRCPKLAL